MLSNASKDMCLGHGGQQQHAEQHGQEQSKPNNQIINVPLLSQ